jgi:hypothetical protein
MGIIMFIWMLEEWAMITFIIAGVIATYGFIAAKEPRPKYDRSEGCIWQHDYIDGFTSPEQFRHVNPNLTAPNGGWVEVLPCQITTYDKHGTVVRKIHIWDSGCWMVLEKCTLEGDVCAPGSELKFKFGGCTWTGGLRCTPSRENWRDGKYMSFGRKRKNADCDHSYVR